MRPGRDSLLAILALFADACGDNGPSTQPDARAPTDASSGADAPYESNAADALEEPQAADVADEPSAEVGADAANPDASAAIGLASRYPCDRGIQSDPAVVFTEDFEEGSVGAVTSRYDQAQNPAGMALIADIPAKSCGKASMKLTSDVSANATDLYKRLAGHDELFVRWYAKYQSGITWHHTGVWVGGYNPATPYPNPQAGLKPTGNDRISVSIEPVFGVGAPNPRLDFYNYWMQMRSWMALPSGNTAYYGNALVHQNAFVADDDRWMCLEVHVKLNTDTASAVGAALDVWKNDTLVQHFDAVTPLGYWTKDKFCPSGADGSECTSYPPPQGTAMIPLDLQWRTTTALQLNYFWPQNYITQGPAGSVQYDDMLVATARVGCLR